MTNYTMSASFSLRASRSHRIYFVKAQSRWMTTSSRVKRGDLMSMRKGMGLPYSLLSSQRRLRQPRLVNNPGQLFKSASGKVSQDLPF